ncbi:MAG: PEP-CTERM sorting domain-containing protein [Phycisphaerales bacterium]
MRIRACVSPIRVVRLTPAMCLAAAAGMLAAASGVSAQSITSIGLPQGGSFSGASAVSANGSVVAANVDMSSAYRWTSSGLVSIGLPPDAFAASAEDISSDGSVIVGGLFFIVPEETARAHRWTSAGGFQDLGVLPGGIASFASGVSGDGNIVTGGSFDADFNIAAFRWTSTNGMQSIGTLPGGMSSEGRKVSRDGGTIIGIAGTPEGDRAFAWTESGGMQNLGLLSPGDGASSAWGVSADGTVVAGSSGGNATIWTNGIAQNIGMLPGASNAIAFTMSDDGSLVGGYSFFGFEATATLWSQALGTVDLNTYLPTLGVDLTGWELDYTRDISSDGTTIVGEGLFNGEPRGWVVTIPAPGATAMLGLGGLMAVRRRRR